MQASKQLFWPKVQPILGPSDLSRPLRSQEKSLCGWRVGGENQKYGISHLTFSRPGPGPELDNILTT